MADPYKDKSREELLAECIRLRDQMQGMTTKSPRVFRYWHACLTFLSVSFLSILAGAYCIQITVSDGKPEPLFIVPGVFFGALAIGFFIWGWACVSEHSLTERFLPQQSE